MRYERKFRVEGAISSWEIESMLSFHPLSFSVLFPPRQVNNIYLDTADFGFFRENLAGAGDRKKIRIRWYGENIEVAENPVIEWKLKHNELGWKEYKHVQTSLPLGNRAELIHFVEKHIPFETALIPSIMNWYQRSYYQSMNGKFRLTVDHRLMFRSFDQGTGVLLAPQEDEAVIVEVKYEQEDDQFWQEFTEYFPFRLGKNSKYVNGVLMTVND